MKASQFFVSTLKEAPADAEVASHRLMLRAGFIKRLSAGIYTYMPMGLRVIRKIEGIVREEMNRAGAVELLMPVVQPAELWQESGRFQKYGPELMRVKDRHDRDFVIQPTSEEVITDIARQELRSYRALPKNFYHIQTKFRDERRPRFGVMRGREFTMKDAYSFDRDLDAARFSYDAMFAAYVRIFERMGLVFRAVAADNGSIGGIRSHEFQVIAETGEDAIVYSTGSDYAANIELAEAVAPAAPRAAPMMPRSPRRRRRARATCEDVAALLGLPLSKTVKSLVLATDGANADGTPAEPAIWLLLVRGDHSLNEVKAGKLPGLDKGFRFASAAEIDATFGCKPGYLGPIGTRRAPRLDRRSRRRADERLRLRRQRGRLSLHRRQLGPRPARAGASSPTSATPSSAIPSPDGKGTLQIQRGIEVGHVFLLGSYYSQSMNATFLDEKGQPQLLQMGCYGIGITRIVGAAIEQNHDERGMIWPLAIAPFAIVICPIGYDRSPAVREAADALHAGLVDAGIDVVIDDRGERPGAMFADWELIGVPHRIVLSDRGLKTGELEYQGRRDATATPVPADQVLAFLKGKLAA